jgi:hypothetical protein
MTIKVGDRFARWVVLKVGNERDRYRAPDGPVPVHLRQSPAPGASRRLRAFLPLLRLSSTRDVGRLGKGAVQDRARAGNCAPTPTRPFHTLAARPACICWQSGRRAAHERTAACAPTRCNANLVSSQKPRPSGSTGPSRRNEGQGEPIAKHRRPELLRKQAHCSTRHRWDVIWRLRASPQSPP